MIIISIVNFSEQTNKQTHTHILLLFTVSESDDFEPKYLWIIYDVLLYVLLNFRRTKWPICWYDERKVN